MSILKRPYLHPLLAGLFPVAALLGHNLAQIQVFQGLRALAVAGLGALVLLGLLTLLLRSPSRAALLATLALVLFYAYGHVYQVFKLTEVLGVQIGRHRVLLPLWLALFGAGTWYSLKGIKNVGPLTEALNVFALIAMAFPVTQALSFEFQTQRAANAASLIAQAEPLAGSGETRTMPDIYYILFDSYARDDVLLETFGQDNANFLSELEARGFYVARCSRSNYAQTELSLSSTLNLNYLHELDDRVGTGEEPNGLLPALLRQNRTTRILKELGYHDVAFETGYYAFHFYDADYYFSPGESPLETWEITGGLNSFEVMLIKTTAGLVVTDAAGSLPFGLEDDIFYPNKRHRERVLFDLEMLERIPNLVPSPKFVFALIISPHEPYVFDENGEYIQDPKPETLEGHIPLYRDQVRYLNQRILEVVDVILSTSRTPPVIILQADHGPAYIGKQERTAILNAYHLPDGGRERLYETISPVNSFRTIFSAYFGFDFERLEDVSYFSDYENRYAFEVVPNSRPGCPAP